MTWAEGRGGGRGSAGNELGLKKKSQEFCVCVSVRDFTLLLSTNEEHILKVIFLSLHDHV